MALIPVYISGGVYDDVKGTVTVVLSGGAQLSPPRWMSPENWTPLQSALEVVFELKVDKKISTGRPAAVQQVVETTDGLKVHYYRWEYDGSEWVNMGGSDSRGVLKKPPAKP